MNFLFFYPNTQDNNTGLTNPNVSERRVLAPPQTMNGTIHKFEPTY